MRAQADSGEMQDMRGMQSAQFPEAGQHAPNVCLRH